MSSSHCSLVELDSLADKLEREGFLLRRGTPFFAPNGFAARTSGENGRSVFVYFVDDHWMARSTRHGGPHWIRPCNDVKELRIAAVEALGSTSTRPSAAWCAADAWASARYTLHKSGRSHFAMVDVDVGSSPDFLAVRVDCAEPGFSGQGHIEDVGAGYEDWKDGARAGANFAADVLGLRVGLVRITRIQGLTSDTSPAAVAAATVLAMFRALAVDVSAVLRATLDDAVAAGDLAAFLGARPGPG
jgi:hypothetical protein